MGVRQVFADTRPLADPHFRRLWLANIVTVVGAQLTIVAVPAQIYAETHSSAYVGLTGVFGLVPLVVFGLWGGALADVMDRRTLLVVTTVGLIVTSGLFWAQAALGLRNVWALLVLFAVQQAFFAVNQPTRSAILPKLLPPDQLPAGNSLNMTVMQAGGIAGLVAGHGECGGFAESSRQEVDGSLRGGRVVSAAQGKGFLLPAPLKRDAGEEALPDILRRHIDK